MCRNFFDIRTFGAVMTTEVNCGQVRGPVQLTFARSVDPIIPLDLSITRVAITKKQDIDFVETEKGTEGGKVTEMGRKALVPTASMWAMVLSIPILPSRPDFLQRLIAFLAGLARNVGLGSLRQPGPPGLPGSLYFHP